MSEHKVDIVAALSKLALFSNSSAASIATIAAGTTLKSLHRGELLFQRGDPSSGFYVVLSGQIKLGFSSANGDEKVVDILGPGQSFGEAVMFMDKPYPVFAEALLDATVLHIPQEPVFRLLETEPLFARRMLAGLSARLHSLVQDVESYSLRSGVERLIGFLLQAAAGKTPDAQGHVEIELPASKHVIASRLNLVPESYSRAQHKLVEKDLVSVHGRRVVIHSLERLRDYLSRL